ncbi:alcohol dehydrogenase catalytic domain-containing protein [Sphingomonas sp. IC-56]|uniref:alcohol dehydrogenase catalytic domain-containing protein n=1 Tax=Sphingomonas sp. IC-56 TaxID=2898529 RepID=UPI003FA6BBD3
MFRIAAHSFGAPDQALSLETADRPLVDRGQVLVRMRASPINPSDLIPVTGAYRHRTALPFIPGFEGVGVVADVGEGINPVLIGRRVLPLGTAGCWQSWKTLPADWCVTVPEDLDDDEAATAYINPLTALLMVRKLAPKRGDRIGVTAAGSAIGRMLIRMLAARARILSGLFAPPRRASPFRPSVPKSLRKDAPFQHWTVVSTRWGVRPALSLVQPSSRAACSSTTACCQASHSPTAAKPA